MKLQWIDPLKIEKAPPDPDGWNLYWHGYHQMTKVRSANFSNLVAADHQSDNSEYLRESQLERQLFLNIVNDIPNEHVVMVELGAGRGDWCLALAGTLDHNLLDCTAKTYECVALEAEPTHCEWAREHFERQGISAIAVWGAAYNYNGEISLAADKNPSDDYGQTVQMAGNLMIPCFTLRELMRQQGLNRIDLLHMDIQGAEISVILECAELFASGAIRYLLIGTHNKDFNSQIIDILGEYMEFYINIPPASGVVDTPFGKAHIPVDGLMLGKSKIAAPGERLPRANVFHPFVPHRLKVMPLEHLEYVVNELKNGGEELAACRAIRRWAAQRANVSSLSELWGERQTLGEDLLGYEQNTLGGLCDKAAMFLAKLYGHFDFAAASLDFGPVPEILTHVFTIVSIRHHERDLTIIQDPYINAEYVVDGYEVTSLSRYLLSMVLSKQSFKITDHYPDDYRQRIERQDDDGSLSFQQVRMFDGGNWFVLKSKQGAREYMSACLNTPEEAIGPQHMLLFPILISVAKKSENLMREITFYQHQVATVRKFLVNPDHYTDADYVALEESLEML